MTSPRRFTLLDAIILVAAFAIGFGWVRAIEARKSRHPQFVTWLVLDNDMPASRLEEGWRVAEVYLPCVASLTLAVAVLGFVRPSPGRARLSRRPGFAAAAAASLALTAGAIRTAIGTLREIVQASWRFLSRQSSPARLVGARPHDRQPGLVRARDRGRLVPARFRPSMATGPRLARPRRAVPRPVLVGLGRDRRRRALELLRLGDDPAAHRRLKSS